MMDEPRRDDQALSRLHDALPVRSAGDALVELEVIEADAEVESRGRQAAVIPRRLHGDAGSQRGNFRKKRRQLEAARAQIEIVGRPVYQNRDGIGGNRRLQHGGRTSLIDRRAIHGVAVARSQSRRAPGRDIRRAPIAHRRPDPTPPPLRPCRRATSQDWDSAAAECAW